ncbi:MAG: ABC transporter ATP-binding protein [Clostridiales Family XIII bacterium]|jgi:putative ABC transport system ATP-binding protein|nr:ABC transporter ATP-binding protein [Clostridiales Family XIII bacterium]
MLLSVSELKRTYKRGETAFPAVEDVSFAVGREDFVCITGESGSGKSTLLHLLTGLLRPDGGSVVLEGRNLASLSDGERSRLRSGRVGYIPQGYSLLNSFSVLDNVCLPCNLYGKARAARRETAEKAKRLLERMGVAHLSAERPQNLSGGEQRRVAIARSVIASPVLLVADEPTGDLDPDTTDSILEFFAEIHGRGTAVVMVTHERDRIPFANRYFVMEKGRLREVGS